MCLAAVKRLFNKVCIVRMICICPNNFDRLWIWLSLTEKQISFLKVSVELGTLWVRLEFSLTKIPRLLSLGILYFLKRSARKVTRTPTGYPTIFCRSSGVIRLHGNEGCPVLGGGWADILQGACRPQPLRCER